MKFQDFLNVWDKLNRYYENLPPQSQMTAMIGNTDPNEIESFGDLIKKTCDYFSNLHGQDEKCLQGISKALEAHRDNFTDEEYDFLTKSIGFNNKLKDIHNELKSDESNGFKYELPIWNQVRKLTELYNDNKVDEFVDEYVRFVDIYQDMQTDEAYKSLNKNVISKLNLDNQMTEIHKKLFDKLLQSVASLNGENDDKKIADFQRYNYAFSTISESLQNSISESRNKRNLPYYDDKLNHIDEYYNGVLNLIKLCENNKKYESILKNEFLDDFIYATKNKAQENFAKEKKKVHDNKIEAYVNNIIEKNIKVTPFEDYFISEKEEFENENDKNKVERYVNDLVDKYMKADRNNATWKNISQVFDEFKKQNDMTAVHQYLSNRIKTRLAETTNIGSNSVKKEITIYADILNMITGEELKKKIKCDNKKISKILLDTRKNNHLFELLCKIELSKTTDYDKAFNNPHIKMYNDMYKMIKKPSAEYWEDEEFIKDRNNFLNNKIEHEKTVVVEGNKKALALKYEIDYVKPTLNELEAYMKENAPAVNNKIDGYKRSIEDKCNAITSDINILADTNNRVDRAKNSQEYNKMAEALDLLSDGNISIFNMIANNGNGNVFDISNSKTISNEYRERLENAYNKVDEYVSYKKGQLSRLVANGNTRYNAASRIKEALAGLLTDIGEYNKEKTDLCNDLALTLKLKVKENDKYVDKEVPMSYSKVAQEYNSVREKFNKKEKELDGLTKSMQRSGKRRKEYRTMLNAKNVNVKKSENAIAQPK